MIKNLKTNFQESSGSLSIDPSWKEIIKEIGKQLHSRKGLLLKRTLLIIWPGFIVLTLFLILTRWENIDRFFRLNPNQADFIFNFVLITWFVFIFFFIIYFLITRTIFYIEKWIWVDSYFDKRNLDSKTSWKLAKKFFFPVVRLYFESFWRFYLPVILIWIILTSLLVWVISFSPVADFFIDIKEGNLKGLTIPIIWVPISIIALYLYFYYLKVFYLRFSIPYFLDTYKKQGFSFNRFFKEVKKLAKIDRNKLLWKSIVIEETAGLANRLKDGIINTLREGINEVGEKFGKVPGKIAGIGGAFLRLFAEEASSQAVNFAKIIAVYLLYRARCLYFYKSPGPKINF